MKPVGLKTSHRKKISQGDVALLITTEHSRGRSSLTQLSPDLPIIRCPIAEKRRKKEMGRMRERVRERDEEKGERWSGRKER